jgi:hypothetical protein
VTAAAEAAAADNRAQRETAAAAGDLGAGSGTSAERRLLMRKLDSVAAQLQHSEAKQGQPSVGAMLATLGGWLAHRRGWLEMMRSQNNMGSQGNLRQFLSGTIL